jgi:hypothetical protein
MAIPGRCGRLWRDAAVGHPSVISYRVAVLYETAQRGFARAAMHLRPLVGSIDRRNTPESLRTCVLRAVFALTGSRYYGHSREQAWAWPLPLTG